MSTKVDPELALYGVIAVAAVYVLWNAKKAAGAVVDTAKNVVTKDLNPASDQNLAYRGVNGIGSAITGQDSWTLGGWLYDITHTAEAGGAQALPTYTEQQLGRIGGQGAVQANTGDITSTSGTSYGSFDQISKSNPLDPETWGLGLYS